MSPVLPFDVIAVIVEIVRENKDIDLLKELALVSHSFYQACIKHLFANINLRDAVLNYRLVSSKKEFVELLKSRPHLVKSIRKLTYEAGRKYDDHLLAPTLSNFLPTISCLNCLAINGSYLNWNALDSSLRSAFLHLMSLPTINHIDLSNIKNFPLSSLTSSVNLLRLDMTDMACLDYPEEDIIPKTLMLPKIRELHTSNSYQLTKKLFDVKGQDGRPVFNFMDLRQLSMSLTLLNKEPNIRRLLQNAKLFERLHLSVDIGQSLVGVLSTNSRTLKVLDLTAVPVYQYHGVPPLAGLCEELEVMEGHNTLEALRVSFDVLVDSNHREDWVGSTIQEVENVLVKPGWSALRQVSFKLPIRDQGRGSAELTEALQYLPDKYLSRLSKLESVAFNYSAYLVYN